MLICIKVMLAVIVWPGVTFGGDVGKVTTPVTELYTPVPSSALVTVTLAVCRPTGNCRLKVALVAVPLAAVLVFTKLAVPLTTVLTGALAGNTKLALMSAWLARTLKVALLLPGERSLMAPVVPVP